MTMGVGLACFLLAVHLVLPASGQEPAEIADRLDIVQRRGATEDERRAVSDPQFLDRALAGVWQWGSFRIVVAEDPFNCLPSGHCPFVLIGSLGAVPVQGIALERPGVAGDGSLVWIEPSGALVRARPVSTP